MTTRIEYISQQTNTLVIPGPNDITEAGVNIFDLRALLECADAAKKAGTADAALARLNEEIPQS